MGLNLLLRNAGCRAFVHLKQLSRLNTFYYLSFRSTVRSKQPLNNLMFCLFSLMHLLLFGEQEYVLIYMRCIKQVPAIL